MEDDADVRKLVEFIFIKQSINIVEVTVPNSSIPTCLLTRDFSRIMHSVLTTKQQVVVWRWRQFFDNLCYKMLTSHEMYLWCIMFACQVEYQCDQNVFESFISICAILNHVNDEMVAKTEMDFSELYPDIFMAFYQNTMKEKFLKCGGFQGLIEYIRGHRYLAWNKNDHTSFIRYKAWKIVEEVRSLRKERIYEAIINSDEIANDPTSLFLAQKVLATTSVAFPTLLSKPELVQKLVAYRRSEIAKRAASKKKIEAALKFNPFEEVMKEYSNSNSEIKHEAEQKEDIAEYEGIIEAVIKYNHSKSSDHDKSNNQLQKEAYGILEHLKDRIKSLIEIVDKYDEE